MYEVFIGVLIKIQFCWDVTLCRLVRPRSLKSSVIQEARDHKFDSLVYCSLGFSQC
jgi:hypothetical protein